MTKLHIKQAQINDIFELILSDPGSIQDVPLLIKKLGHSISLLEQTSDNVCKYQVKIN
ncbi:MAG: sulfurtransferase TusA family protein [Gammaproteobacteria bacterium]|nr:sulfurtransferase TusA family protein [Gammaproteobacteria bacterium]